jgi:hypothetical protein
MVAVHDFILSRLTVDNTNNNNNAFTWSGPSGVLGCTGQRPGGPLYGEVQPGTQKREIVVSLSH